MFTIHARNVRLQRVPMEISDVDKLKGRNRTEWADLNHDVIKHAVGNVAPACVRCVRAGGISSISWKNDVINTFDNFSDNNIQ